MLKYKCLVLDHDDTVVMSSPEINYPSFLNTLSVLRPGLKQPTLAEFMYSCFTPGFHEYCTGALGFTPEEMEYEFASWKEYSFSHAPSFFPGMAEVVKRQRAEGGLVCVSSHSSERNIRRDYAAHCGFEPDMVFGWEIGELRKPHPFALTELMRVYSLEPADLLMVDDLKPGCDMAHAAGVHFAYAGWSCKHPAIREFMACCSDFSFATVAGLAAFLFEG